MKRHLLSIAASVLLVLAGALPVLAQEGAVRVLGSGTNEDAPGIEVVRSDASGLVLDVSLPSVVAEDVSVAGEVFQAVAIPGGILAGETGHPALPIFSRALAIPDRSGVRVTAHVVDEEIYRGIRLLPMQPDEGTEFVLDTAAYGVDQFSVRPVAQSGEPAISRGLRLAPLQISPVSYNPARQELRVAHRLRVEVAFEGEDLRNVLTRRRPVAPSFEGMYRDLLINYEAPTGERGTQPGTWLIICRNDNNVISRLQPLLEWRQRKGLPVRLATTQETGTSNSSIRNFIQAAYDTWETPPEYVVLAGDAGGSYSLPTFNEGLSGYGGEGDHPYTKLDGGDVLSDVHIGRLSFESLTELEIIVAKIVGYESAPYIDDPTWFTRACLVGDTSPSGYSCIQVMQGIKTWLRQLNYTQVDTVFSNPFVSQMTTALNRGDTIFAYRGYLSMSGWGNSNTYAMTNGSRMSFAVMSTCGTGSFAQGTARSEAFLRAGDTNPIRPKGAIAAVGTATTGTHTRFNNCYTFGAIHGALFGSTHEAGPAHTRGKLELYLNYIDSVPTYVDIFSHWNNLMGDPATALWTGYPDPLAVTHPGTIAVGTNAVTVSVSEGGGPSAGARVCLLKGTETFALGWTDEAGVCELPITPATQGTMLITVTKHNRHPYAASITVNPSVRFVSYEASTVDDDGSDESAGNGDQAVNPGETIELPVKLHNFGMQTASNVTAILTSDDPYVTVTDADEEFGSINGGASAWSHEDFGFTVDPACPHGRMLRFGLDISSGSEAWHALIEIPAVSAEFAYQGIHLYNTGGNSLLDPGETCQLSVGVVNSGGLVATGVTATVLSLSQWLDLPDPTGSYPNIGAGDAGENTSSPFTIHASPDCPNGYLGRLKLLFEFNGGLTDTLVVTIPVGTRASTDPTGPDAYGYYAFDNTDTGYPQAPVYEWVELDPVHGGNGTEIVLGDTYDYGDKTRALDLPFPFRYYGQSYSRASVCSNGWIVMGDTYLTDYRNWTLPSTGGPNGIIAVFWDDLYQQGSSKAYQRYDSARHRWIVQWSRFNNWGGGTANVQAIFLDPAHYPTDSGDGIIIFQYNQAASGDGTDGYFTVGIEKPDNTDGLTWAYFNDYTPGSATISAGRAIAFVPVVEHLTGQIRGTVKNLAGGQPLPGATVTVMESGHEDQTGPDGAYLFEESPGTYSVMAAKEGFEPDTVSNVVVSTGGLSVINFTLRDITAPVVTPINQVPSTPDSLGPYPVMVTIQDHSTLEEATLYYRIYDGSFSAVALQPYGSIGTYRGLIPGQRWTSRVDYYMYARDAAGNVTTFPANAPDGVLTFWVGPLLYAFVDNMENEQGWSGGIEGDDATAGVWERVDPNGTTWNGQQVQPEDDHSASPGTLCWVTGNAAPGSDQDANDVDGGVTTLLSPQLSLAVDGTVLLRYWRWFSNDTGGPGDDSWTVLASNDDGANWTVIEQTSLSQRSWRYVEVDLGAQLPLTEAMRVKFVARDQGAPSIVEAAVDDLEIVFIGLTSSGLEASVAPVFGLSTAMPNPLRPGASIGFALPQAGGASLVICDLSGRVLRTLVDSHLTAGRHAVVWDGRDDNGHTLATGVYFTRLQAGAERQTRKVLVLR